jgi:hypothetical protein
MRPEMRPHMTRAKQPHTRPALVMRGGGGKSGGAGDNDGGGTPLAQVEDPPPLCVTPDPLGVPLELMLGQVGQRL